jgi:hypothetical protein
MYGVCPGSSIEYKWRRQTASENRVNRVDLGGGGDRRNWKRLSPVRQSVSHWDMYVVLRNTTLGMFGGETVLLSAVCLVSLCGLPVHHNQSISGLLPLFLFLRSGASTTRGWPSGGSWGKRHGPCTRLFRLCVDNSASAQHTWANPHAHVREGTPMRTSSTGVFPSIPAHCTICVDPGDASCFSIATIAQISGDNVINEAAWNVQPCDNNLRNAGFTITAGSRPFPHDLPVVTEAGKSRSLVWWPVRMPARIMKPLLSNSQTLVLCRLQNNASELLL